MSFGLLTALGLREHHRLLDVGCGSLRIGRVLIPYLGRGNYVGVEPNPRALETGVRMHLGESALELKTPTLIASDDPGAVPSEPPLDLAFAQSIFSHTGPDLLAGWLAGVSPRLAETGVLVASYVPGADSAPPGWEPLYVTYSERWLGELATASGLELHPIDWRHPGGQRWALFSIPGFDTGWVGDGALSWNSYLERTLESEHADVG